MFRTLARCSSCFVRSSARQPQTVTSQRWLSFRQATRSKATLAAESVPAGNAAAAIAASQKAVGVWLFGCTGMIFGAVVLGGVTRLTESGLSMTDWHPVKGVKPPVTEEEWEAEFERYKQFPEYKYSSGMSLEDFKRIFYMEYAHRMWGRLIGMAYILPAAFFWARGYVQPKYKPLILTIGGLIGLQGVIGWIMVKSGLDYDPEGKHVPRVSQYRLALHLGSAFVLYVMTLYTGMMHLIPERQIQGSVEGLRKLRKFAHGMAGFIFFTAMSGAFVAGLDAGLVYNEFPLMGGRWIPTDLWHMTPSWLNVFENPTTAQFDHRILGTTTGLLVASLWAYSRKFPLHSRAKLAANAMLAMVGVQITLGIATLLYFVPTELAATHQAGSLTLLTFATWFLFELRRIPK